MNQPTVVKYSRRLKRISLQRYLVSKIVHEADHVKFQDLIVLYDNQIWLEQKSLKDPDFNKKFGSSLEELSFLLKQINFQKEFSAKALIRLSQRFRTNLEGFIVPIRNYQSFKKHFSGLFSVLALKTPKEANKILPPKRIIGVGYRDKGTARDPAKDGSPSWQEVASRSGQLALAKKNIREAKSVRDFERVLKDLGLKN